MNSRNLTFIFFGLFSLASFAQASDYACSAGIVQYSADRTKVVKNVEKVVKILDREGRSRAVRLESFDFTVTEPDPMTSVVVLRIYDFKEKEVYEVGTAIAARPTNEVEATLNSRVNKGSTSLTLTCKTR
jgi:hypothetical protein